MKIISLFNNKGGVGKTTLAFHLSHCLAEMGHKVLMIDADPQCNLTISSVSEECIEDMWERENGFVHDFEAQRRMISTEDFEQVNASPRTLHYLLKTTEEGISDIEVLPPVIELTKNLGLIAGRLTMHMYEDKLAERWNGIYRGDPLSIRTVTRIRHLVELYGDQYGYEYAIIDTSPSLGILNKVIISTVDGFVIPCLPDMFSLYGIQNIGDYLSRWKSEFDTIYGLISNDKRAYFPRNFVSFLGFTIYNAKKYAGATPHDLARAHYNYATQIPITIERCIQPEVRVHLTDSMLKNPVGLRAITHSHNTLPNVAQKYRTPMWSIPALGTLDSDDVSTIRGNRAQYEATKNMYEIFSKDLLTRIATLDE